MSNLTRAIAKYYVQIVFYLLFFATSLFLPARSFDWTMGWIYMAINAISMLLISLILLVRNPGLLDKRADRKGKRDWDRILAGIMSFFGPISMCIVAGFNFQHRWPPQIPFLLQITGIILAILGCLLTAWAVASNQFFYGFFRIDKEAGHSVSANGAYQYVRHPGYLGAILIDLATPLILNSVWAFIPAVLTILAIFIRTSLEDKALQSALEGYKTYTLQVRYRLIPAIW